MESKKRENILKGGNCYILQFSLECDMGESAFRGMVKAHKGVEG